jgi:acetyl-CoA carboxylase biotin carboxyl carrier protein
MANGSERQFEMVSELANIMTQNHLQSAEWTSDGFTVAFKRKSVVVASPAEITYVSASDGPSDEYFDEEPEAATSDDSALGTPVKSPMTGVFYATASPNDPPYVKVGQTVSEGDILCLIEAMKVFSEVFCTTPGTVTKIVAQSGSVVNVDDVLMYIKA